MTIKEKLERYGDVEEWVSLVTRTTFRVGGKCRYFVYPKNELCLREILRILKENNMQYKIFGKGSNLLCSDDDYDGAILCLDRYLNECYFEEDGTCCVQAGCSLILLAHEAMKRSLRGLEFASGIPGTLGGAVFMNAGAYKSDMASLLQEVSVLKGGQLVPMRVEDLAYRYRHSAFQQHPDWVIVSCRLKLEKGEQKAIRDLMDSRRKRRLVSQPLDKPSAGSTFRNPEGHQAWELIERAGLRGARVGGAMVSTKHSNFIINEDHATASDVLQLIENIQRTVKERFEIELLTEVEKFNWKN